jgi:hypothetical protein
MNTAYEILVIILSSFLAIFLALAIAVTIMVMKLVQSLRLVVAKGEHLVDSAEEIGEAFRRNAAAASLVRVLMGFVSGKNNGRRRRD